MIPQVLDKKSKFILIFQTAPYFKRLINHTKSVWPHDLTKGEDIGGMLSKKPQPSMNFYGFHIKNSRFSTLSLSKKDMPVPAVSTVTIIGSDQSFLCKSCPTFSHFCFFIIMVTFQY